MPYFKIASPRIRCAALMVIMVTCASCATNTLLRADFENTPVDGDPEIVRRWDNAHIDLPERGAEAKIRRGEGENQVLEYVCTGPAEPVQRALRFSYTATIPRDSVFASWTGKVRAFSSGTRLVIRLEDGEGNVLAGYELRGSADGMHVFDLDEGSNRLRDLRGREISLQQDRSHGPFIDYHFGTGTARGGFLEFFGELNTRGITGRRSIRLTFDFTSCASPETYEIDDVLIQAISPR
ncbi:MAG: hypothetical protein H0U67_02250 [Gemmatimonadetes bacterium]|nr:hypothetical protein [Gemmatimonadota bacterium]